MARLMALFALTLIFAACTKQPNGGDNETSFNPSFLVADGKKADPNYRVTLPADHQSHPQFDIEWWYLTANLADDAGTPYAFQWTLFRFSNRNNNSSWHKGQTYMAHTSLHTPYEHWFEERFAVGGVGNALVALVPDADTEKPGTLTLGIDDWQWQAMQPDGSLFPATLRASVTTSADATENNVSKQALMRFTLTPTGPFVLQGKEGYSVKSKEGQHASHYYSLPFISISGTVETSEHTTRLTGKAWYDHEWTSTLLDDTTAGWDWMSLHFDNGDKLMAFSMRLNDTEDYQTGTYINADGSAETLLPAEISLSIEQYADVDERKLPLHWQVSVPSKGLDIKVIASKKQAYNPAVFGYYEGPVVISGSHTGVGFLELTGY